MSTRNSNSTGLAVPGAGGRRGRVAGLAAVAAGFAFGVGALQAQSHVTVDIGARDPAFSPDGSTVAVSILGKIWTLPAEGGAARQLTDGASWDTRPAWSPDGRFLAYAARTRQGADILVRNMATGGVRFLHHVPGSVGHMQFHPDGSRLFFVDDRSQYEAHVWRIPLAGGEAEQITHTRNWHEWSFALSPDGSRVLLETGRFDGTDLYELDLEEMSLEQVTDTPEREMAVAWSADGTRRAHVMTHNGLDQLVVSEPGQQQLLASAFDQKQLAFHPSGEWLLVLGGRRMQRLDLETGEFTPIPFEARFEVAGDPADDLLITNVRLFDGTGDEAVAGAAVLVRDGRIAEVRTGAEAGVPEIGPGTPVIDGGGRMLLPGLMDNHYHYWQPLAGADLLAAGITAIRDPGSAIQDAMDFKDAVRLGVLAGPDVYTAGPLIDGPAGYHPLVDVSIDDPTAAPALVRALKEQGVDLLKAYFLLDPDVLAAVVAEARVQGLPVTGHIGVRTSWRQAIEAGISGFNHIRVWRDFLPLEIQVDGRDMSLDGGRNPVGRMQADWREIDPASPEVTSLLELMAETETGLDPTLYIQEIEDSDRSRFSLPEFHIARQAYERMGEFVRRAVEAGVPLLAGTDNVGLFNELEAYAQAGVPNAAILRAATANGARWLGKEDDFGTVQPGRRAHLILVDGDPLADIADLRNIDLVVKDGVIVFGGPPAEPLVP
ncbi:amidohydrolase family protein [Candidatus Palauibacter sp.]|uniref:amidohydrolase family protein n=1 Tax=Candidatus Palauibacter sp. TaxID=3101350 RepID=UPI003B011D0B